jgi:hypothetical protein
VTTGLMVGRSKPGCGLCPALSFKDLHHPCWGGERGEPELYLQHSGERALTDLAEGADFDNAGPASRKRRQLQRAWLAGSAGSSAASGATSHRWGGAWLSAHRGVTVASCVPGDRPRRRTSLGRRSCSWIVLSSLRHDASTRRSVSARPRGLEWGSAGAGWGATRGQTSVSLALMACPHPSCGDVGEGLPTAASALRSSLLLFSHLRRRSLSLLLQRLPASHPEFVVTQVLLCGGCSYPREWNRSFVCNGTLSAGVCSLRLSGSEHLCIWA